MDKNISPVDQDFKKFDEINESNEVISEQLSDRCYIISNDHELYLEAIQDVIDTASASVRGDILEYVYDSVNHKSASIRASNTFAIAVKQALYKIAQRQLDDN